MNAEEYKSLINKKDVLDHTTLNVTLKELVFNKEFELAESLKRILANNRIAKPKEHSHPHDTTNSYYQVDLSSDNIELITDHFSDLEVSHLDDSGDTTPTASFYASLFDKWNELS